MDFEKVWDIVCDHCRERGFYFLDEEDKRFTQRLYRDGVATREICEKVEYSCRCMGREYES